MVFGPCYVLSLSEFLPVDNHQHKSMRLKSWFFRLVGLQLDIEDDRGKIGGGTVSAKGFPPDRLGSEVNIS